MSIETARPTAQLEFRNGRPVIIFNGKPISHAMYSDPMVYVKPVAHSKPDIWLERYKDFRDSGVHNYSIGPVHWVNGNPSESRFWSADGVYPDVSADDEPFCVDKQAQALLEMDPEATFFVRFGDEIPKAWIDANPDIIQQSWNGEVREFYHPQPSLGSEKGLRDVCTFIRRVLEHCEAQPWSDRVFGYMYYPRGEGITNLNVSGFMFDVCPAMQDAFKGWIRERYPDEAALQAAWGNPALTFDAVRVPTDAEWRADMDKAEHWVGGDQLRRYRDYWELQQKLFIHWYRTLIRTVVDALSARPVVFGIDMAKQPMLGWQHNLSFSGVGPSAEFLNMFTGTGSIDTAELLDEPGLDMLVTPADYTARSVGYGWEPEGIADSLHLRGKAILVENDARTFAPGEDHTLGAFRTPAEVKAGLLRNAAWSLSRGHFDYWMIAGGQYFHHPEVQEVGIRTVAPLLDAAPNWPHQETEHAIAMIIDDASDSLLAENGTSGYLNLAILWQRVLGLAHCGIPYRVYLFSDLLRENMPDYRCYLFPNLFKMDEDRLAVLQQKVFRDGRLAIFGPSTGITDGKQLSADWASRLLGVEMELVNKHAPRRVIVQGPHPIAQALPASLVYGDSQPYGPILIPAKDALEKAGADHLGMATTFWGINRPGLFVNDCEEYQIAWSAAMPLPSNLLRELARFAGCHVWCEEDDVVLASDTIAAIHSVKGGRRTLKFPSRRPVWDLLTGEQLFSRDSADKLREVTVEITPPETRLFYFGKQKPY